MRKHLIESTSFFVIIFKNFYCFRSKIFVLIVNDLRYFWTFIWKQTSKTHDVCGVNSIQSSTGEVKANTG
jgi:hypothetical protein